MSKRLDQRRCDDLDHGGLLQLSAAPEHEHGIVIFTASVESGLVAPSRLPYVSVVLPCYNEEASVGACVDEARRSLTEAGLAGEVLVVDNNSTDRSHEEALRHGARVVLEAQPGYGSAVRRGIDEALGDIVVMADADLSYELAAIPALVEPIILGTADFVVGERLRGCADRAMPLLHRYLGTPALSFLVRRASPQITVTDSQSGFRAFRRSDVLGLGLRSGGMELASEMLIKASRQGLRIVEVPTRYRLRVGSSKLDAFADGWRHLREILFLTPHWILLAPGAALVALWLVLESWSLVDPFGLKLGSLTWQPVFFSGIALVLGVQCLVAGLLLADHARAIYGARGALQRAPMFSMSLARRVGLASTAGGLLVDVTLFVVWLEAIRPPAQEEALAGLAQSLIIVGVSLAVISFVFPLIRSIPTDRAQPAALSPLPAVLEQTDQVTRDPKMASGLAGSAPVPFEATDKPLPAVSE